MTPTNWTENEQLRQRTIRLQGILDFERKQLKASRLQVEELKKILQFFAKPLNYERKTVEYMCHGSPHSYRAPSLVESEGLEMAQSQLKLTVPRAKEGRVV
jgi:hypothetical protein